MDVLGLQGKVAVVTGGGGNIGTATVRLLAQLGANVLVADSNIESAENAAARSREDGGDAVAVGCDVRRPDDIERMVEVALERWDRLDVGVNIVGGGGDGMGKSALELTDEEWEASVETNLYSAVRCCRVFARVMLERNIAGSLVNIASPAGLRAGPGDGGLWGVEGCAHQLHLDIGRGTRPQGDPGEHRRPGVRTTPRDVVGWKRGRAGRTGPSALFQWGGSRRRRMSPGRLSRSPQISRAFRRAR